MASFSAAVIAEIESRWGPVFKSRRGRQRAAPDSVEGNAADTAVELEAQLPARYLPGTPGFGGQ